MAVITEIWEDISADAERGCRRLVSEYGDRLLTAARHITQNAADAEDLVFRTFAQAVRKIGTYNGRNAFFTWLYTIMLNFRRMDLRRKAANAIDFMDELPECEDLRPNPAEALVQSASAEAVRRAVMALPETLRVPVVLRYYEDFDVSAIAAMLEVPVGTVKFRLYEARRRMAAWLVQTEFRESAYNAYGDEGRGIHLRGLGQNGTS